MLFTCARIDRKTVPEDLSCYDVRHDDDCRGIACEIKPYVVVMGDDPDKNGNPDDGGRQLLSKRRYELSWGDTYCGRVYAAGHAGKQSEGGMQMEM